MSNTCPIRPARRVELVVRDLNHVPRLFIAFLSAARILTQRDMGAFRHWALHVGERRYELRIKHGNISWNSNEFEGLDACQWIVCAQASTDRFDEEIYEYGV
jgi:hypothetical protein